MLFRSIERLAREQPILLAAMGAALGAAVGSLLPMSATEKKYMAEASGKATRAGRETLAKVVDVVKSETLGDHPETKVAAVAEKVARAVTKEISNPVA